MKKMIFTLSAMGVFFTLTAAMCETETPEPTLKDYSCKCVYVNSDTTIANKEETTALKAENNDRAYADCKALEFKYGNQWYTGSCGLQ